MHVLSSSRNLLRARGSEMDSRVSFVELFFDLVFVFAVTQLSHLLAHHFSGEGIAHTALLMMAMWWVWIYTSWVTNWVDPQTAPVRLMLFVLMLAGLVLSMSIPDAFGEKGLAFGGAVAFMQIGRSLFMCWALRRHHAGNYRNFLRITTWLCVSGTVWVAGGFCEGWVRYAVWLVAVFIEYLGPAMGFWTPRIGRSTTTDWDVSGAHLAERCGLFVIIVLGESLLMTGATFGESDWTLTNAAAFLTAFVGTVAMWWIYFDVGAERASERIARSADPGRIARVAYTYLHTVVVAGLLLVAVADEILLAHPTGHGDGKTAAAMLGGPGLYLFGVLLFKKAVFQRLPWSHVAGIALLAGIYPFAHLLSPLGLAAIATVTLVATGAWETFSARCKAATAIG